MRTPRGPGEAAARRASTDPGTAGGKSRAGWSRRNSLQLHAWVDGLVQQVREEVQHHGGDRDIDRHRLDHREIAALDREYHLPADPRDGKEALDQERAGDQ